MARYQFTADDATSHSLHDTNTIGPNMGFVPDVDGTLRLRARHASGTVDMTVVGGAVYPIDIELASSTGSSGVTAVVALRQTR